jgi:hypothetical protein
VELSTQHNPFSLGVITFDLFGIGDTTSSYATDNIAPRIVLPRKLHHYAIGVILGGGGAAIILHPQNSRLK